MQCSIMLSTSGRETHLTSSKSMNFLFILGRAGEVLEVAENPMEMWIVALYAIKKIKC